MEKCHHSCHIKTDGTGRYRPIRPKGLYLAIDRTAPIPT